jgi:Flp pilus assembly protein TadB
MGYEDYTLTLKLTVTAFYIVSAGLLTGAIFNIATAHKPEITFLGIIISILSIVVITWLMMEKNESRETIEFETFPVKWKLYKDT